MSHKIQGYKRLYRVRNTAFFYIHKRKEERVSKNESLL